MRLKSAITVDVQMRNRARPPTILPLVSIARLRDTVFPQQSITAAVIHIKDSPKGFYGHAGICGERDNWIGLNYPQIPITKKGPLRRLRSLFDPVGLAPLRGIHTLALGSFEFASHEEQRIEVIQASLRELDQVRLLKVYAMDLSLLARILQPSYRVVPLPSLEELQLHAYNPPELTRCAAHDEGKSSVITLKD